MVAYLTHSEIDYCERLALIISVLSMYSVCDVIKCEGYVKWLEWILRVQMTNTISHEWIKSKRMLLFLKFKKYYYPISWECYRLVFFSISKCSFYKGCCPGSSWNSVTQQCESAFFSFFMIGQPQIPLKSKNRWITNNNLLTITRITNILVLIFR